MEDAMTDPDPAVPAEPLPIPGSGVSSPEPAEGSDDAPGRDDGSPQG